MNILTSEITRLLDKLYNLRGEDSIILTKMEEEKKIAEETKSQAIKEKETLQNRIEELTEEEKVLSEEGERLSQALSKIKSDDYKNVINKLNIDFDPDDLNKEIGYLLPKTIRKVQKETNDTKKELVKVEEEMNNAIATIEELSIRKEEALSDQGRLNEYFELAFNGNSNITRESIASLLENFEFSENEQKEAAKLLMFPEDALLEYDRRIKNPDIYQKEEVKELTPKEKLINLLNEYGFDYMDFTASDMESLVDNFDEDVLRENISYIKGKNIKLDIFIENAKLLYDEELKGKIESLIKVGKMASDIYLYPNILTKYNKAGLDNTINKFENSGLDPKMVPLIAY